MLDVVIRKVHILCHSICCKLVTNHLYIYIRCMLPNEIKQKRILLSPLNWGMGHVARCIPLIHGLLKNGNTVFVAANSDQQQIFKQYFPNVAFIDHSGYPFNFGEKGNFALDLAKQFGALRNRMKSELLEVEKYVEKFAIDVLISDHRYGFRSEKVHSIILTHQLNLPVRWFEGWVQKFHHGFLRAFNEVWIPDTRQSELSGNLSHNTAELNAHYVGSLSRFSLYDKKFSKTIEKVIIVSGPLVYAKRFLEEQLTSIKSDENFIVFIAPKELTIRTHRPTIQIKSSENWLECDQIILQAKQIISHSGYSTLMDLSELKVPFTITPTPGQREQEYLFDLWNKKSFNKASS